MKKELKPKKEEKKQMKLRAIIMTKRKPVVKSPNFDNYEWVFGIFGFKRKFIKTKFRNQTKMYFNTEFSARFAKILY